MEFLIVPKLNWWYGLKFRFHLWKNKRKSKPQDSMIFDGVYDKRLIDMVNNNWVWKKFEVKRKYGKYPAEYIDWFQPISPSLMSLIPKVKIDTEKYQWRFKDA